MKKSAKAQKCLSLLFVLALLAVAVWGARRGAERFVSAEVFKVGEVEVAWLGTERPMTTRLRLSPAVSVFSVDLNAVHRTLQEEYPAHEVQVVRRIFPNRVVAFMRQRQALAQIRSSAGYHPVSSDGTVVDEGRDAPVAHLPVLHLKGVDRDLRVGETVSVPSFWAAVELLRVLDRQGGLAGRRPVRVEAGYRDIFLWLDSGPELRFTMADLGAGWQRLGNLLAVRPGLLDEARYVDLRYEDPVVQEGR